jgi:DNA-binding CsgD family transcriptional regulator
MGIEQHRCNPRDDYAGTVDEVAVAYQRASTEYIRVDAEFDRRLVDSRLRTAALAHSVNRLSFGIIAFDQFCRILEVNAMGRELMAGDTAMNRSANGVLLLNEPAQSELRRHMADWKPSETWIDRLIRIPRNDGRTAISALLIAVPPPAVEPIDESPGWVLFLFDPAPAGALCPRVIAGDLRITHREAQIAAELAAGESLGVAARRMGIKLHTARSHLRSMFLKVGVRSQGKLLRRILTGPASCLTHHIGAGKIAKPALWKSVPGGDVQARPQTARPCRPNSISSI